MKNIVIKLTAYFIICFMRFMLLKVYIAPTFYHLFPLVPITLPYYFARRVSGLAEGTRPSASSDILLDVILQN